MLAARDVWFGYAEDTPVLRGISLDVRRGAIVGILGPNGSGKTTLLRLLAGTRQPQRGVVTLDETHLSTLPRVQLARRMAVVPQETHLAFDYTVHEVAMMGRYAHLAAFQIEGPSDMAIVDDALAATGTLAFKDRPFATLSGGEKQRVVIAAALAQISDGGHFRLKAEATEAVREENFRLKAEATETVREENFRLKAEATETVREENFRLEAEATETVREENFRLEAEATETVREESFRLEAEATETVGEENFRLKAEATRSEGEDALSNSPSPSKSRSFRLQAEDSGGYLLLDEPTASLDLGYQLEVADLLKRLRDERGVSVVVSTHDLALAGTLCETLLLIRDGERVAYGATDDVLTPENVRRVYGVDVDVIRHASGRRVLVPVGRAHQP